MSSREKPSNHFYLSDLFRFIENNISDNLDTEILSRTGYVSSPKLYRDFYNLTGHSVKEYIRKRRLSNALALIKTSEMELTDMLFNVGIPQPCYVDWFVNLTNDYKS